MMKNILLIAVAAVLLASLDESTTAEAIIRMENVPDSKYTELNGRNAPAWTKSIVMLNNMHSSCPNGAPSCRMKNGRKTPFKVDCHATLISNKLAITSRHCFCHKGKDVAYNSGFNAIVGGRHRVKVKRTWVNRKCEFSCRRPGSHNECDYAIVEFVRKIPRSIKPIKIFDAQRSGDEMQNTLLMAGYGSTGVVGKMSAKRCNSNKQDGKLRAAAFKVTALGKRGNDWGENKYGILRYKAGGSKDSRLPQGLAAQDDHGIPAFIMRKGTPLLVGVHAHRVRNIHNLKNPCKNGAKDEFTRLTSRKTHAWIKKALSGRFDVKHFYPLLHKYNRNLDQLPLKTPGSAQYPYHHEYGHRRRRSITKAGGVPGGNKCRNALPKLMEPLKHKINMEVCGGLPPDKWPLEFFDRKFGQKIEPIMNMQNAAYRWDKKKRRFRMLKKNPYHKHKMKAMDFVETQHYTLMRSVRNHFRRLVLTAGKFKVPHRKRVAATEAFRILVPMEKKVKELQVKVKAKKAKKKAKKQRKKAIAAMAKGKKWVTHKLSTKQLQHKLNKAKWPRAAWRKKNSARLSKLHFTSFAKAAKQHHRLRVPGSRRIIAWWKIGRHGRDYPRPHRSHRMHTTTIGRKRFSVFKFRAWKKHMHILRKWGAHYRRKGRRVKAAMKKACKKNKGSKKCLRLRKKAAKVAAKAGTYNKLMKPYKRAVRRGATKIWTPTSVVRAQHNYRLKVKKKKMKKLTISSSATKSSRRRSWLHFNPFKSKSSSKKKKKSKKSGKKSGNKKAAKGKRKGKFSATFRSAARGSFEGGKIHIKKHGQKKTRAARCFYYRRQAKAIVNMKKRHPLKSAHRGKLFSTIRLPKSMLKKLAAARAYLKKHCKKNKD